MFSLYLRKVAKVTSNLKSPFKVCSFPSYFFLFFPNFSFSIGILKFVANMFFCGLSTMWSLWGYGWLGFGLFVMRRVFKDYKLLISYLCYTNFILYLCFTCSICLYIKSWSICYASVNPRYQPCLLFICFLFSFFVILFTFFKRMQNIDDLTYSHDSFALLKKKEKNKLFCCSSKKKKKLSTIH